LTIGGSFTLINRSQTVTNNLPAGKALTLNGAVALSQVSTGNQFTLTVTGPGNTTIAGAIAPGPATATTAGITKTGAGTLNLTNNNVYGGTTAVSAGLLLANNTPGSASDSATGSGPVNVTSTGVLGGSGQITGTITISTAAAIAASGTIAPGNSAGTLTVGSMVWNRFGQYNFEYNANNTSTGGGINDFLNGSGTLNLGNLAGATPFNLNLLPLNFAGPSPSDQSYTFATFASGIVDATATPYPNGTDVSSLFTLSGAFTSAPATYATIVGAAGGPQSLVVTFTPVPEPTSILLVCGGVAGLTVFRRKRRKA
jgi:autotransporter-associated beta strand protein